ncbi:MAG: DUF3877 family protein [Lachnospiraceae bacterium]|nr:DUF3877 family protein [Lachnospiraceae bacterium]
MKLEKHILDTMKEWQLKLGSIDQQISLYYPVESICDYLQEKEPETESERTALLHTVKKYLSGQAPYLGDISLSYADSRMCINIPAKGSLYVAENIKTSDFLKGFLEVLKQQNLDKIKEYFHEYAARCGGTVVEKVDEEDMGTVLYFEQEDIDPYVYCIDQDVFGVTYHRFAREDYEKLQCGR